MLLKFRFANYKSFRDEAVLDLRAAPISEYDYQVREIDRKIRVLPVAAIFGGNASGKSNVIDAFKFMLTYVGYSGLYNDPFGKKRTERFKPEFKPFAFSDADNPLPAMEFEVWFIDPHDPKKRTFNYGFALNEKEILQEWLYVKSKTGKEYRRVFFRDSKESIEFESSKITKSQQLGLLSSLHPDELLVSLGGMNNIELLSIVRNWFSDVSVINYGDPFFNAVISNTITPEFASQEETRKDFINFISKFDDSFLDFEVKEAISENPNSPVLEVRSVHKTPGGNKRTLPFSDESAGTLKLFSLYPYIKETLESGGVLFIDELNSRLHPLAERLIIQAFTNPESNPNNAQMIFTSHDSWILEDYLLRRDEFWFTEKDQEEASSLYSLYDFEDEDGKKIRKDENYLTNYLSGKYGAIPDLKQITLDNLKTGIDPDRLN